MALARLISRRAWTLLVPGMALLGAGCVQGDIVDGPATVAAPDAADEDAATTEDSNVVTPPVDDETGVAPPSDTGTVVPPTDTGGTVADTAAVVDTAPPPKAEYPVGPYGKTLGATIPNLAWKGYRDGTGTWTDIKLGDYYDPDAKLGVRALKIGMAALW